MVRIILILSYIIPLLVLAYHFGWDDVFSSENFVDATVVYAIFVWLPMFCSYLPYLNYPKEIKLYALVGGCLGVFIFWCIFISWVSQLRAGGAVVFFAFLLVGFSGIPISFMSKKIINRGKKEVFTFALIMPFVLNSYIFIFFAP